MALFFHERRGTSGAFKTTGPCFKMDINQFTYVAEICRLGSMSKAAEYLHMTQQGLSLSVKRLEEELGCSLFLRKSTGLEPTDVGRLFLQESQAAMEHINRIYQYCETVKASRSRITVACTMNLIVRVPVELRHLLLHGDEDFELNFIEDWTSRCEKRVLNNQAHFGLVYGPCDKDSFQITTLDVLKQVFIVNKNSPLAGRNSIRLSELAGYPLIVPSDLCRPGIMIRSMFKSQNIPLNIVYTCDRPRQIIEMVSQDNMGARIILDDVMEKDLKNVHILTLEDDPFLLPICLIYKTGRKLSMQERYLIHLIMDCFSGDREQ